MKHNLFQIILGCMILTVTQMAAAEKPGAERILVGQSAGLTGGQAHYSKDVQVGIQAAFAMENSTGGVNGRELVLVTLDDGGKKAAVLANTKRLVENERVVALLGYTSGAGVEASLDYLAAGAVPMLSPATGNMGIRAKATRTLFHTRAGYDREMLKIVNNLALTGRTRFATAFLEDAGPDNPKAMREALMANKLTPVAEVALNRNATSFTPAINALLASNPEVVLFISNSTPIVQIVKGMRERGYGGQFASSSFAGLSIVDDLGVVGPGLILSQVLPATTRSALPIIQQYRRAMQQAFPDADLNPTSLEGYIGARVLIQALRKAGRPTGEGIIRSLEDMHRLDLGGYEVSFSRTTREGSRFADTAVVSRDKSIRF